jgi:restriction system protein
MPYKLMYELEIRHEGLGAYRHLRGSDQYVVTQKAQAQQRAWNERWQKIQQKEQITNSKLAKKELAEARTAEAGTALRAIENILTVALTARSRFDWDALKDHSPFSTPKPLPPPAHGFPPEPRLSATRQEPALSLLDRLLPSRKAKRELEVELQYQEALRRWQASIKEWKKSIENIENLNQQNKISSERILEDWNNRRECFLKDQETNNAKIDDRKRAYLEKSVTAIVDYCDCVLGNSGYPDSFPKSYELEYLAESRTLLVDYQLPALEDLPLVKEVKYVASRDELIETKLTDAVLRRMYDELLYKISLRSMFELFRADEIDGIESIVFNGWVQSIDRATGQEISPCILSVQAMKSEFLQINLSQADPKACFKKLKGVGSSKLCELAAIRPILTLNKEDRRFVSAYDVAETLDDSINIAAMDWKDFENLIRELFERVFSANGGEVKITQASRDGGVDAVAFDPDPIRGGKIVIQAKRYTNTVGLSAIRDLYGTVHNEGAIKGILVTTADYGPDAYAFAKDKPLTLLNGSNLLHLLSEHGHRAKIDLSEAKRALKPTG